MYTPGKLLLFNLHLGRSNPKNHKFAYLEQERDRERETELVCVYIQLYKYNLCN